jgi:hypothetical protein
MTDATEVECGNCGRRLPTETLLPGPAWPPCPICGSTDRHFKATLSDKITVRESWKGNVKDPTLPGKQKVRREFFSGYEKRNSQGDYVYKERYIDRDANRYRELVREESGTIIRDVDRNCSPPAG